MGSAAGKHTVRIFCGFLAMMTAGLLLLPKREFSPAENRNLEELPKLSGKRVMDGSFMSDFENYISDHVPLRDQWVHLHAAMEKLSGKQENGGVYFGREDTLLRRVEEPDPSRLEKNIGYINSFTERCGVPVYLGLIPTAAQLWTDRLPAGAPTADEQRLIGECYESCAAIPVDMSGALTAHGEEEIFYRTDHHWTTLGAFYGMNAALQTMGQQPLSRADYSPETVSDSFRGTLWSASGAWWTAPDTIEKWVPEEEIRVRSWFGTEPEEGALYHDSYLEEKDQYSYFLGGNQPLCVIESSAEGGSLLVIRDSYADAAAPFLTERYSELHLFDLRYNKMNVQDYIAEHEIDAVLILYGFSGFAEDRNLVFLDR